MQLVILAGGKGTRISEESNLKPKPLVEIGNMPIIWHIMKFYSFYGIKEFIICVGYKGHLIKEFFSNYNLYNSDLVIDLKKNKKTFLKRKKEDWKITIVDTGLETLTGGRIKRIEKYIKGQDFCLTYGDGLSDVNLKKLIRFHKKHKKYSTVTIVKPSGKFGAISLEDEYVTKFQEKPDGDGNWINGGFFVLNKKIFKFIKNDNSIWEREPLEKLSSNKQLKAFKHNGFWSAMDTLNDKKKLEKIWYSDGVPWRKWDEK
ncbi:glucose-1-phosphate cytidylyltransferase [Candidatus Pelagibacter sp.]|jgi:glucose-1-phosphate cytidylyltransferase|nr:glucose-1-phosphate cytidylyltransferase [Candidatus Pelagibacter sp.]